IGDSQNHINFSLGNYRTGFNNISRLVQDGSTSDRTSDSGEVSLGDITTTLVGDDRVSEPSTLEDDT
ncbi:hypothetical protein L195_g048494, partial [Trifolium pratense]